jgi:hypothetical protein
MVRIWIHIKQLDPDPYQIEKQDPDQYQSEKQDPNPYQKGLDPQLCLYMTFCMQSIGFTNSSAAGVDVTANQEEISDFETFQLEWEPASASWYIRTMKVRTAGTSAMKVRTGKTPGP